MEEAIDAASDIKIVNDSTQPTGLTVLAETEYNCNRLPHLSIIAVDDYCQVSSTISGVVAYSIPNIERGEENRKKNSSKQQQ